MSIKLVILKSGEDVIADVKELVSDDENVISVHRRSPMPETNVTVTDWLPN